MVQTRKGRIMVVKQVFAVASAAFVAFSLSITANGETLKITTSDANNKSSLVTWNVSGGGTAAPCKGNTYVVDTKLMVRTPNDQKTFSFAGDLLRIGSSDGDYGTLAPCRNSAIGTVTFPGVNGAAGLILEKGFIQPYKANSTMTIAGKVKVTALDSDPFVIRLVGGDTATNNQVVLSATLEGERSTMLRTLVYKQEKMRPSFVALDCDASNFMGTFDVYSYDKDRPCDCYLYNSHSFGGELIVRKWSSLLPQYASTLWTIGTLRLDAGSTLATKLTINSQRGGDSGDEHDYADRRVNDDQSRQFDVYRGRTKGYGCRSGIRMVRAEIAESESGTNPPRTFRACVPEYEFPEG